MYPESYISFLSHFHSTRDYFECHEILEDYWKSEQGGFHPVWEGLIQVAVGYYHFRRGNLNGAKRMFSKSRMNLEAHPQMLQSLGLDASQLLDLIKKEINSIDQGESYASKSLPIQDVNLKTLCQSNCKKNNWAFGANSQMDIEEIIHKHMLRDRSDVIKARDNAIRERRKKEKRERGLSK